MNRYDKEKSMKFEPKFTHRKVDRLTEVFSKKVIFSYAAVCLAISVFFGVFFHVQCGSNFWWIGPFTTFMFLSVILVFTPIPKDHEVWAAMNYDQFNNNLKETYGLEISRTTLERIAASIHVYAGSSPELQTSCEFTIGDKTYRAKFLGDEVTLVSRPRYLGFEDVEPVAASVPKKTDPSTLGTPTPVDGGDDIVSEFTK